MPIEIYTDGSSNNKIKDGGYGFVIVQRADIHDPNDLVQSWARKETDKIMAEGSGGLPEGRTSSSDMELAAIYHALTKLRTLRFDASDPVYLWTDSTYARQALVTWIVKWRKEGWLTSTGAPVANRKRIQCGSMRLQQLHQAGVRIRMRHIKGHAGYFWNEYVDNLAGDARKNQHKQDGP